MSKELNAAVVEYVSSQPGVDAALIASLRQALGVSAGETSERKLETAWGLESVESSAKFQQYLSKVEEKGYFKGVEKGSAAFQERYNKLVAKYKEKFASEQPAPQTSKPAAAADENNDEEGDKFKEEGNAFLLAKEYEKAVEAYTKAIDVCGAGKNSHIYYCNRAAALLNLNRNEEALEDCTISLTLSPDYGKAHARSAQASQRLGRKEEAVTSAKRALELEPNSAVAQAVLKACGGSSSDAMGGLGGMGGMAEALRGMDPNTMDSLRGMMGGGGMPDISSMMNNPQMMAAAQQMMQNPQMMEMAQKMMQDPNAMSNLMNMFGGGMPR